MSEGRTAADEEGAVPHGAPPPGMTAREKQITVAVVTLITVIAFETMAIAAIMPITAADLEVGGGYGLAFSSMFTAQLLGIVAAGALMAARGSLGVLTIGQVAFALGSLVAGAAPTFAVFLAGRLLAGLGAGFVIVAVYVVIGGVVASRHHPRVFAWLAAAWVLPAIAGPVIAGQVEALISWRAVFWCVIPFVVVTLALLTRHREVLASAGLDPGVEGAIRWRTILAGAILAGGAGLVQVGGAGLVPVRVGPVALVLGGLVMVAYALPRCLPVATLRSHRGLPAVLTSRFFHSAGFNSSVAFLPLFLVQLTAMGTTASGMVLATSSVGWALASWLQGLERTEGRQYVLVGVGALCCLAGALGYVGLAILTPALALSGWWMVVPSGLAGFGMGFSTVSLSVLTLRIAPARYHAAASSGLQLGDVLGSTAGLTVVSAVFAALTASAASGGPASGALPYVGVWAGTAVFFTGSVVAARRIGRARPAP